VHIEKWRNATGLDFRVMREKQFLLIKTLKVHWKERSTLFCGQNLKVDVHLFVDEGSNYVNWEHDFILINTINYKGLSNSHILICSILHLEMGQWTKNTSTQLKSAERMDKQTTCLVSASLLHGDCNNRLASWFASIFLIREYINIAKIPITPRLCIDKISERH
jgi:hypothetical protein